MYAIHCVYDKKHAMFEHNIAFATVPHRHTYTQPFEPMCMYDRLCVRVHSGVTNVLLSLSLPPSLSHTHTHMRHTHTHTHTHTTLHKKLKDNSGCVSPKYRSPWMTIHSPLCGNCSSECCKVLERTLSTWSPCTL